MSGWKSDATINDVVDTPLQQEFSPTCPNEHTDVSLAPHDVKSLFIV